MNCIVLGGGISPEKNVSKRSAKAVMEALEELGHTVTYLDTATSTLDEILKSASESDIVFPILHGIGGEDGELQRHFVKAGIPYFGPSPEACDNTFDKAVFKKILEKNNLPTPRWNTVTAGQLTSEPLAKYPFVLKPISGGSSIDTFIIREIPFDPAPLEEALGRYDSMLIEELIEGSEITVGILDTTALPVVEIIPPEDKEFDYENKYNGETKELCPPLNVSAELQLKAQKLALDTHVVTKCRHLSRTDILINAKGELFIIDTNTIPGLTDQSLFPKAAQASGLTWVELVNKFTQL